MARNKATQDNIDNSSPALYPDARIRDNDGSGNGTPINEAVYGDIHEAFAQMMRLYAIAFNGIPDNTQNGYQFVEAIHSLPTKNDIILNLSQNGLILTVPLKLGVLRTSEQAVCQASTDFTTQSQIRGIDNVVRNVTVIGNFRTGEYVRIINTPTVVLLVRLTDGVNLDTSVTENGFLKAATLAQELAGVLDTVATTPLTNLLAFIERVNGPTSNQALAIANVRNGLLSASDKAIIDNLSGNGGNRRYGTVLVGDVNARQVGSNYTVTGDFQSATTTQNTSNGDVITVTLSNALPNQNYSVITSVESLGTIELDNDFIIIPFKRISVTQFQVYIEEVNREVQNVRLHIDVTLR